MISSLQNDRMHIIRVADFMICHSKMADSVISELDKHYQRESTYNTSTGQNQNQSEPTKMLLYFYVANEVLFKTKD